MNESSRSMLRRDMPGGSWERGEWGHPLKGPCQEEKLILCEKIYFFAKLQC